MLLAIRRCRQALGIAGAVGTLTQQPSSPSRSDWNTIHCASGDQTGKRLLPASVRRWTALAPLSG